MKNIFRFDRFSKFLTYDLNNFRCNYGLSLLVVGFMPTIYLLARFIAHLAFSFSSPFNGPGLGEFLGIAGLAVMVAVIAGPQKIYGQITDKKMGSDYLLIPASTFEKALSMILVTCVLIPVILVLLFTFQYGLFKLCVPGFNGTISAVIDSIHTVTREQEFFHISDSSLLSGMWLCWIQNILTFTLGAIFFKRSKAAKTILSLMLLSFVFSLFTASIGWLTDFSSFEDLFMNIFNNGTALQHFINWFVNILLIVPNAILMGLIYLRLKTIKH